MDGLFNLFLIAYAIYFIFTQALTYNIKKS